MTANTTIKVIPGSRDNFNKLKKYKSGGKVKKLQGGGTPEWYLNRYAQNKELNGWSSELDNSEYDANLLALHGAANNLDLAYKSNAAYTANRSAIGLDLQTWYANYIAQHPNATPELVVRAYNEKAKLIRDYQMASHQNGETGAEGVNEAFKELFNSRSVRGTSEGWTPDDSFIGWQERLKNIYGSSTFLRRMDNYEKEYNQLTDEEKLQRQYDLGNGTGAFKIYKKANGDIELIPIAGGTEGHDGNGGLGNPLEDIILNNDGQDNPEDTIANLKGPLYDLGKKFRWNKDFPTYPFFNGALLANGLIANNRAWKLAMQQKAPLDEAPRLFDQVTGDYTYQTAAQNLMAKNASNVANLAGSTSNIDYATDVQLQGLKQRDDIAMLAAQHQALNDKQERQEAVATSNQNNMYATQTANTNRLQLDALHNALLDATRWRILSNAELVEQNLKNNRADFLNYNKAQLLNRQYLLQAANKPYWDLKASTIYDQFVKDSDLDKYSGWADAYRYYGNAGTDADLIAYKLFLDLHYSGLDSLEAFKKYYSVKPDSTIFGQFTKNWEAAQEKAMAEYKRKMAALEAEKGMYDADIVPYIKGETTLPFNLYLNPQLNEKPKTVLGFKQGGELSKYDRFLQYVRNNRRVMLHTIDATQKSIDSSNKMLKRDLDALDKETLLLLKAIFK